MINKFFIVGTGRIGTLSLSKSLNEYAFIDSRHENFDQARMLSNKRWDGEIRNDEVVRIVKQSLNRFKNVNKLFIDSNCLLWNIIDVIDAIDGNIGYIYIKRDMDATVDSMMRTDFYGKDKYPWEKRAKKGFYNIDIIML